MALTESLDARATARADNSQRRSHLRRIFAVLAAFQDDSDLSLAELTRRVRLPKTTVHRIVHELLDVSALSFDGDSYRVGLSLFALSMNTPSVRLRDAAAPLLRHLATVTESTVALAMLDGSDAVFLERTLGKDDVEDLPFGRPGARLPAHTCAAGKALLAVSRSYRSSEACLEPNASVVPTRLAQELARVRQRQIAIEDGGPEAGVIAMAAPIPNSLRHGEGYGAITLRGPFRSNEQAAHVLRQAARVIGDRLLSG